MLVNGSEGVRGLKMSPDGKYVYASTRGENSTLSIFQVEKDGRIFRKQVIPVTHWPRDFNISPDGKFLLVAGARSNEIELYTINPENGELVASGVKASLPGPTCILFIP